MKVYAPVGRQAAAGFRAAPALATLAGKRVLLLDNGKWNGGRLLRHLGEIMEFEVPAVDVRIERKPFFSRAADFELVDRLAKGVDAVVTAIGD